MEKRVVTHIVPEPLAIEGYTKLSYLTASPDNLNVHFMGMNATTVFEPTLIAKWHEEGQIISLPQTLAIEKGQAVYSDVEKNIYVADKYDPFIDADTQKSVSLADKWSLKV